MLRTYAFALLAIAILTCPTQTAETRVGDAPPSLVFLVGGVGGADPLQFWGPYALSWAGLRHEVRVFEWTHGKGHMLRDLQDTRYLLARADDLAEQVRAVQARYPSRSIYLVGHSAGAALVLAVAEQLPCNSLERVVLLSAAISPDYNLCAALRSSRGGIISFHSHLDWLFLGVGTSHFGTVDRVYCPAAGKMGFALPDHLDDEGCQLYQRLIQIPWRVEMLLALHGGGHNSTCMPLFLMRAVAPWLSP